MRKVTCHECGKVYNFDVDDFCPKCGAFNQPTRTMRISSDGTVVRSDGLNENNHAGSFVHEELHEENKARKRTGLDKDLIRPKVKRPNTVRVNGKLVKKSNSKAISVFGWIMLILFLRACMAVFE